MGGGGVEETGGGGEWKAKVVGEVSCCVRDGRLCISIPVVCVRVGGLVPVFASVCAKFRPVCGIWLH